MFFGLWYCLFWSLGFEKLPRILKQNQTQTKLIKKKNPNQNPQEKTQHHSLCALNMYATTATPIQTQEFCSQAWGLVLVFVWFVWVFLFFNQKKLFFLFLEFWCWPFPKFLISTFASSKSALFQLMITEKLREVKFFTRVSRNLYSAPKLLPILLCMILQPWRLEMPVWHFTDLQ